jgi:tRNA1Val (adenine37-N6)-methyltransferase
LSSINPHYTFHYSQPEGYRFSHDSVFLARRVFERLADSDLSGCRMLDLCAGCGIVGLDFLFHLRAAGRPPPLSCDFLEIQDEYSAHFARNAQFIEGCELRYLPQNYAELREKYDLILCNPPYFQIGTGLQSPNEFKNRCRFFVDSDMATLLRVIVGALAPGGQAFLLMRNPDDDAREILGERMEIIGEIRGTPLVRIEEGIKSSPDSTVRVARC